MDFTLRRTTDGHRTHTGNTRQGIYHTIIQYLIKCRLALVGLYGQQHDRDHIRTELKDDRVLHIIGKLGTYHIQLVTHIIRQHVNIITELKLQCNQRHILRRTGSDVLQITDRVQNILQRTGHIVLDIRSTGSRIGRHHHNRIRINVRIQVDRQFGQREQAKYHHCQKAERSHNRFLNRTFV